MNPKLFLLGLLLTLYSLASAQEISKEQTTREVEENLHLRHELEEVEEKNKASKQERVTMMRNRFYFIFALIVVIILSCIIFILYHKKNKIGKVLVKQNAYIERQHRKLKKHYAILEKEHKTLIEHRVVLEKNHVELFEAHTKLQEQKLLIEELNKNLEKKIEEHTQKLARRNEKLEAYACYNSHVLRAPILRLLGLTTMLFDITLSEVEKEIALKHIQSSSELLDEVTKYMQRILETEDDDEFQHLIQKEFEWNRILQSKHFNFLE